MAMKCLTGLDLIEFTSGAYVQSEDASAGFDGEVRNRIADLWLTGRIIGDRAMKCLIWLGLIEFTPAAYAQSEVVR